MSESKKRIVVLMGGISSEHEISLQTGTTVINNLSKETYEIKAGLIEKNGNWVLSHFIADEFNDDTLSSMRKELEPLSTNQAINQLLTDGIQLAFIALHGKLGEDGVIQGLLEISGIGYTGSGVMSSALAMNKEKSNEIYRIHELLVPEYFTFTPSEMSNDLKQIEDRIANHIGFPCILKPVDGGSSAGTFKLSDLEAFEEKAQLGFEVTNCLMVQQYIEGDEVTCAVLHTADEPIALPPTQIIPKTSEFFDFEAKYQPGASDEITPPNLSDDIIVRIQAISLKSHAILGCDGLSRTDMIVAGGDIFVLETNTVPGMTATSLYPQAAQKIGLSFSELLDKLLQRAAEK
ncbi:MAG: D-alanine--D-alanine ligase [Bacteroidetes bacterium]|nr:D-alanine--D-alanine ligase [Bacteroidota bacterium]